ncbi:hypothetical protein P3T43_001180 [Paraburkholderia sp. GAS41]|uniref:DUF3348 domain-containing protein n=1 Tax=Paraburkholderia sp. GAS41 TaxID=3035134 RepID=UPI003D1DCADB
MLQAPQRTALSGPALIRVLARLTELDVPESSQSLSDRLSQWLGWTDAIGLSTALGGPARSGQASAVGGDARVSGELEERECTRVRASLTNAIVGDSTFAVSRRRGAAQAPAQDVTVDTTVDYAVFRQRYLSVQQTMETAIGNLRGRLRTTLATRTPAAARLAVVDAVMERALSPREHNLLATVPGLLAGHFERLREAERATLAAAEAAGAAAGGRSGAWLDVFRKDMQSVLLAELDLRFQPVEGLLAALLTR